MIKKAEYTSIFLLGGLIYNLIETVFRGYSHWSMTIAGGVCLCLIHFFNDRFAERSIFIRCALGALAITAVEFTVGVIVNIFLGLDVWDYSSMPLNLLGQICPAYILAWFGLSFPAFALSSLVHRVFDLIPTEVIETE